MTIGYKTILHNGKVILANGGKMFLTLPGLVQQSYDYLIDFGSTSYQTIGNWNNVTNTSIMSGGTIALIDSSGVTSGIQLQIISGFTSYSDNGDLGYTIYPVSACRDTMLINSDSAYLRLSGLNNSKKYDIYLFSSRVSDTMKSSYKISDNNGTSQYFLNGYNNTSNIIISPDRVPNNGIINIQIDLSGATYAGINVMEIKEKDAVSYDSSSIQKVRVVYNTVPTTTSVAKTPLRYDKRFALSYAWDDGMDDQYSYGFKYLNGGIAGDGTYSSGKTYTDGCGNKVKFNVGLAIFSGQGANPDVHYPPTWTGINILWSQIKEVYQAGWAINNHEYIDGAGGTVYAVERNRSYIYLQASGATVKVFTEPNGDTGFEPLVWSITGTTKYYEYMNQAFYQQFGNGTSSIPAGRVDGGNLMDGSNRISYASYPVKNFEMYRSNGYSSTDVTTVCNQLLQATGTTYHTWKAMITHSVAGHGGGYGSFSDFKTAMDYIETNYGSGGADNCWMACDQDIYEYLIARDVTIVNQTLNNNILDITFSWNNTYSGDTLPNDMRNYALTLKVSGSTSISDVIIYGGTGCTYNKTYGTNTGLINVKWNGGLSEANRLLNTATERVSIAEATTTANDKAIAQDYVWAMATGIDKTNLQNRLNAI